MNEGRCGFIVYKAAYQPVLYSKPFHVSVQAYMQFFSDSQPPPMAEISRQIAQRYTPVNGTYEVTPQHGPMKASYQISFDNQVGSGGKSVFVRGFSTEWVSD